MSFTTMILDLMAFSLALMLLGWVFDLFRSRLSSPLPAVTRHAPAHSRRSPMPALSRGASWSDN